MRTLALRILAAPLLATVMVAVHAEDAGVGVSGDLRYRLESVSDDAFAEDALASTLRLRLGYATPEWQAWRAFIEFEDVQAFGATDYNSTANGKTAYPVVADPEDTELNQAYVGRALADGLLRVGRQRINLANQRFFGAVGFRQNEQTFDAALIDVPALGGRTQLAYIDRVNRVFGEHHPVDALADTDTRTVMLGHERVIVGVTAAAYAHFIELPDSPAASHRNLGIRAGARQGALDWRVEYASQDEYADAAGIDADYFRVDAGWDFGKFHVGVLREVLGGDGNYAFQTPFATLHAFNGATDKFLVTPVNGLVDDAIQLRAGSGAWKYGAAWHRFTADVGSAAYGTEMNAFVARPLGKYFDLRLELANYSADTFAADTRKAWFTLHAAF